MKKSFSFWKVSKLYCATSDVAQLLCKFMNTDTLLKKQNLLQKQVAKILDRLNFFNVLSHTISMAGTPE